MLSFILLLLAGCTNYSWSDSEMMMETWLDVEDFSTNYDMGVDVGDRLYWDTVHQVIIHSNSYGECSRSAYEEYIEGTYIINDNLTLELLDYNEDTEEWTLDIQVYGYKPNVVLSESYDQSDCNP